MKFLLLDWTINFDILFHKPTFYRLENLKTYYLLLTTTTIKMTSSNSNIQEKPGDRYPDGFYQALEKHTDSSFWSVKYGAKTLVILVKDEGDEKTYYLGKKAIDFFKEWRTFGDKNKDKEDIFFRGKRLWKNSDLWGDFLRKFNHKLFVQCSRDRSATWYVGYLMPLDDFDWIAKVMMSDHPDFDSLKKQLVDHGLAACALKTAGVPDSSAKVSTVEFSAGGGGAPAVGGNGPPVTTDDDDGFTVTTDDNADGSTVTTDDDDDGSTVTTDDDGDGDGQNVAASGRALVAKHWPSLPKQTSAKSITLDQVEKLVAAHVEQLCMTRIEALEVKLAESEAKFAEAEVKLAESEAKFAEAEKNSQDTSARLGGGERTPSFRTS